jgi:hypothetical protein
VIRKDPEIRGAMDSLAQTVFAQFERKHGGCSSHYECYPSWLIPRREVVDAPVDHEFLFFEDEESLPF